MAFKKIVIKTREGQAKSSPIARLRFYFEDRPRALLGSVLGVGCIIGLAGGIGASALNDSRLQAKVERQDAELAKVKRDAQTQVNALAARLGELQAQATRLNADRKSTRLNSSHSQISYAVFCLKKKKARRRSD